MKPALIVVADNTHARIFTTSSSDTSLEEITTLVHPGARLHDRDLTSDLPGKATARDGSGGHAYQAKTDPKRHEQTEFARQVAEYLDEARNSTHFDELLIVAAPAFLGELRHHISSETNEKIVYELDKNLTHHSNEDIRKHLPKIFTH